MVCADIRGTPGNPELTGKLQLVRVGEEKAKLIPITSIPPFPQSLMAAASSLAALRSKIELDLRGRVVSPFNYRDRNIFELVSTGIPSLDAVVGGLPRGAMTEICGPPCSGRTTVLLSALAARTAEGETCALIDARDSFDPAVASAAGVALQQVLWVRCQNADQALRATDLLIQAGGFGLVAVDLSDVAPKILRYVPMNAWFRFRRAVEDTPTILMVLEQESNAKTCASLVLRLEARPAEWSEAAKSDKACDFLEYSMGRLFRGFEIGTDVVRTRVQDVNEVMAINKFSPRYIAEPVSKSKQERVASFKAATNWSEFRG
jgi:recombination protein RecA